MKKLNFDLMKFDLMIISQSLRVLRLSLNLLASQFSNINLFSNNTYHFHARSLLQFFLRHYFSAPQINIDYFQRHYKVKHNFVIREGRVVTPSNDSESSSNRELKTSSNDHEAESGAQK